MNERGLREDLKTLVLAALLGGAFYSLAPVVSEPVALLLAETPLNGALIRFRVNYERNPRLAGAIEQGHAVLERDAERQRQEDSDERILEDKEKEEPEAVRGYLHMLRKTYVIETWRGLYKGAGPILLSGMLVLILAIACFARLRTENCLAWITLDYWVNRLATLAPSSVQAAFPKYKNVINIVIKTPFQVVFMLAVNRAVTTRTPLPFFPHPVPLRHISHNPLNAILRALVTPAELAHPLKMLPRTLLPLLFTALLENTYSAFVWQPLMLRVLHDHRLSDTVSAIRTYRKIYNDQEWISVKTTVPAWRKAVIDPAFISGIVLGTLVLAPLDVVLTRLSVVHPAQEETVHGDREEKSTVEAELEKGANSDAEKEKDAASRVDTGAVVGERIGLQEEGNINAGVTSQESETSAQQQVSVPTSQLELERSPRAFRLRHAPYASAYACLTEVFVEEGWSALLRGWYETAFRLIVTLY